MVLVTLIIIICARYLFLVSIAVFLTYLFYLWKKKRIICISAIKLSAISLPLTLLVAKISSHIINDPRPFVVEHIKPLIAHVADNGFPSDHTLLTMAIASIVFVYSKKLGIVLFIIALLVGTARIFSLVHHPLDIFGSTVIAIVITYLSYLFTCFSAKKWRIISKKT